MGAVQTCVVEGSNVVTAFDGSQSLKYLQKEIADP